jgi:hypothetical protein
VTNFKPRSSAIRTLQPTIVGWALYDNDEQVVFEAHGRDGRRRCLAYAADQGVLHVRFAEQLHAA